MAHAIGFVLAMIVSWTRGTSAVRTVQQSDLKKVVEKQHKSAANEKQWPHAGYNQHHDANNQQWGANDCRAYGGQVYTWDDFVWYCQQTGCSAEHAWNQAERAPCNQNHGYAPGANNQQWGANDCRTYRGQVYTWDDYVHYCQQTGCNAEHAWNQAERAPCNQNHGYTPGGNNQQWGAGDCRTHGGQVYTWHDYVQYCQQTGCNAEHAWNQAQRAPCNNANSGGGDHAPEHRRRWKQAATGVGKNLAEDLGGRLLDKWLPK